MDGIEKAIIEGTAQLLPLDKDESGVAIAKDRGYRTLRSIYCSPGVRSKNGDRISLDEIVKAKDTIKGALVNIDHDWDRNVGSIVNGLEIMNGVPISEAKLSSEKYPDEIADIERKQSSGDLKVSWEVLFGSAKCSECGEEMGANSTYRKYYRHVAMAHANKNEDEICRDLFDVSFNGQAVLMDEKPGFPNAKALAIAKQIKKEGGDKVMGDENTDKGKTPPATDEKQTIIDLHLAVAKERETVSKLQEEKKAFEDQIKAKEAEIETLKKATEDAKAEYDKFKADIESKNRVAGFIEKAKSMNIGFTPEKLTEISDKFAKWDDDTVNTYLNDLSEINKIKAEEPSKDHAKDKDKEPVGAQARAFLRPSEVKSDSDQGADGEPKMKFVDKEFTL